MKNELYFESFPLSLMSISIPIWIATVFLTIIGTILTGFTFFIVYFALYIVSYILNLRYRTSLCSYYGLHVNRGIGKFMSKFIKPSPESLDNSIIRIITALISIFTIIIPIFDAFYIMIIRAFTNWIWITPIMLGLYILGVIIPAFVLKKKIKVCEMPSK